MRRARITGQAAVNRAVNDLLNKFEYPNIDTVGGTFIGGGGGAPTVVIAPSDATASAKARADLIASGIQDQDTVMAARALLKDSAGNAIGGRIVITEGSLVVNTDEIDLDNDVHLLGMGPFETVIQTTDTSGVILTAGSNCTIENLNLSQSGAINGIGLDITGSTTTVKHCHFNALDVGVDISAGGAEILIAFNRSTSTPIFVDGTAAPTYVSIIGNIRPQVIQNTNGVEWIVANNVRCRGVFTFNGAVSSVVQGNTWDEAIINGSDDAVINFDNSISGTIANNVVSEGGGYDGIKLVTVEHFTIADNAISEVTNGIVLDTVTESAVTGNVIGGADDTLGAHGIQVDDSTDNVIEGNLLVYPGTDTDDTFDGILLEGDSDDNQITGNKIIPAPSAGNQTRYGINISASTCNTNAVFANYLGDSSEYGTADSVDSGTGTILAASGGVIGGQFAY